MMSIGTSLAKGSNCGIRMFEYLVVLFVFSCVNKIQLHLMSFFEMDFML